MVVLNEKKFYIRTSSIKPSGGLKSFALPVIFTASRSQPFLELLGYQEDYWLFEATCCSLTSDEQFLQTINFRSELKDNNNSNNNDDDNDPTSKASRHDIVRWLEGEHHHPSKEFMRPSPPRPVFCVDFDSGW